MKQEAPAVVASMGSKIMAQACRITGQMGDEADMLRFVLAPDGVVTPDLARKLPGAAFWTGNNRTLVAGLATALADDPAVRVPSALADNLAVLLVRRVVSLLGLARKAGKVVLGFTKVEAALKRQRVKLLLVASDGAENGRRQIASRAAQAAAASQGTVIRPVTPCEAFTVAELGLAFGRANVIHAAVTDIGWARRIESEVARYKTYIGSKSGVETDERYETGR